MEQFSHTVICESPVTYVEVKSFQVTYEGKNQMKVYLIDVVRSNGTLYNIFRPYESIVQLHKYVQQKLENGILKTTESDYFKATKEKIFGMAVGGQQIVLNLSAYFNFLINQDTKELEGTNIFLMPDNWICQDCVDKRKKLKKEHDSIINFGTIPQDKLVSEPFSYPKYEVISTYTPFDKSIPSLKEGTVVEIYKKCFTGWWVILYHGKLTSYPSSNLQSVTGTPESDQYMLPIPMECEAISEYNAVYEDEVSFEKGDKLVVLQRNLNGWWVVKNGDNTGFSPGRYIDSNGFADSNNSLCNSFKPKNEPIKQRMSRSRKIRR